MMCIINLQIFRKSQGFNFGEILRQSCRLFCYFKRKNMKSTGIILLLISSFILVLLVVMSSYNVAFPAVFYLTCIGQFIFLISVYKILTDKYTTDKTFNDWYEDAPRAK